MRAIWPRSNDVSTNFEPAKPPPGQRWRVLFCGLMGVGARDSTVIAHAAMPGMRPEVLL
jgi:hypothetical protein